MLVVLWVFASALSYCLAVAIVHFRDTGQIVGIVMQLWFFLTPVMYPVTMIPEDWNGIPLRRLLALNPMADFVEIARLLLYELRLPPLGPVLYCGAWTVALVAARRVRVPQVGPRRGRGDMTDYAIEAVGLSKKFLMATERRTSLKERLVRGKSPAPKTFWALKDATFSVPKGSSLGIIGHNGSGKSTALKVLTGIYRPTSGHGEGERQRVGAPGGGGRLPSGADRSGEHPAQRDDPRASPTARSTASWTRSSSSPISVSTSMLRSSTTRAGCTCGWGSRWP